MMDYNSDNDIYSEDYRKCNESYFDLEEVAQEIKWAIDDYVNSEYIFICESITYVRIANFINYINRYY